MYATILNARWNKDKRGLSEMGNVPGKTSRVLVAVVAILVILLALSRMVHTLSPPGGKVPEPTPVRDLSRFASPELPLDRGTALVVVLAMDCSHCIETARLIGTFDAAAHGLQVYFVLFGPPAEVDPFFATIGTRLPYCLATAADYADFAGEDPPAIYLLKDGSIRAEWPGARFNLVVLGDELSRDAE